MLRISPVDDNRPIVSEDAPDRVWQRELPQNFIPFDDFRRDDNLESISTEQQHPYTTGLSQAAHNDITQGLELLLKADELVISGLTQLADHVSRLSEELSQKLNCGGRIFIVGCGSSGSVAIDIAAKCKSSFPDKGGLIQGFIAGGDSAVVRPIDGVEDSEADGKRFFDGMGLGDKDTVILISASGSPSFNVGAGHSAAERGAKVLYFYNSGSVPERTQQLFIRKTNPVIPLCVDIGPQAIAGATHLQGATFAEAGVGSLVTTSLYLSEGKISLAHQYHESLLGKIEEGIGRIRGVLDQIKIIVAAEHEIFADTRSNFFKANDLTDFGYVTFIAREESAREVLIDLTPLSSVFSTHPIGRESEGMRKRAELQAYLLGRAVNNDAWKALLGRHVRSNDIRDTEGLLLSCESEGVNSYAKRPKGEGNLLIGVAKMLSTDDFPDDLLTELIVSGGPKENTALILICRDALSEEQRHMLRLFGDRTVILECVPHDAVGFSETILLKQILNLISIGSMTLMNKVHGNLMIDVKSSGKKPIDRCMRLVKKIWSEFYPADDLNDELLYKYVAHVSSEKRSYDLRGDYTPSTVKIILAMLALDKTPDNFQEVVDKLREEREAITWI